MQANTNTAIPEPQVTISQGTLWGKHMRTRGGRTICAFQGIPYAKPPVGELRFQPPQEPEPWQGPRQAKKEGPKCEQIDFVSLERQGDEDCLYLNVYTPKLPSSGAGYSVMVWVPGGGYVSGGGDTDLYGPEFLLDHDVILVTINYRLGIFGFLNLGTPEAPGNYGMKDQVAALRWVQKNIAKFGGDSNSVTIFGESAGGGSVHHLLISPLARGLFHRAVVQSGSAHAKWALHRNAVKDCREFASRFGCTQTNVADVLKGLRGVDAKDLFQMDFNLRREQKLLFNLFGPSLEPAGTKDPFLTEFPQTILERGDIANVPIMAGVTTHEGLVALGKLHLLGESFTNKLTDHADKYIPEDLQLKNGSLEYTLVCKQIIEFYSQLEPNDLTEAFLHLNSDSLINNGVDELVRGVAALRRNPVFYYQFSYEGKLKLLEHVTKMQHKGTNHADELGYLFKRTLYPVEHPSREDLETIDRMTTLWTNFAKTGNPTPDSSLGVCWEPVVAPFHGPRLADTRYLDIGNELVMKSENLNENRVTFWQKLHDEFSRPKYQ